jgi:hypothetical protein
MLEAYLNFQKHVDLGYFKIFKKSVDLMKELIDFWLANLICYNFFWKPWLFIKIGSFILLRTMIMNNSKKRPDYCLGVGSVSCFWVTVWHWSKVQTQLGFEKLIITREQFK